MGISGSTNVVCSECFNTSFADDMDSIAGNLTSVFIVNKTNSLISIIKKHIDSNLKRYSENDGKDEIEKSEKNKMDRGLRMYLSHVYYYVYNLWVKQLSVHNLVDDEQSESLCFAFNAMYNGV